MSCAFNYSGSKSEYTNLHKITEPVVDLFGGGGGFWSNVRSTDIHVNDINVPLVRFQELVYKSTEEEYGKLIHSIFEMTESVQSREEFEALRSRFNETKDPIIFMSLLATCTNNMIRFNKSGGFNQTWGKRKFNANMRLKLDAFRNRIKDKNITFSTGGFDQLSYGDKLMFVDPPYLVSMAGYNSGWGEAEEHRLYAYIMGKRFVMTNFLRKGENVNMILKQYIESNGWSHQSIRTGKMKAQRDTDQTFDEIVVADSDETINLVLSNRLF